MSPGLSKKELLSLVRCPACLARLRAEASALACVGCGARYDVIAGRPVLLVGAAPGPCKANDAIDSQAQARVEAKRPGVRGLLDRFRAATTVDTFADDRQQVPRLAERARALAPPPGCVVDVGACEQYYREHLQTLGPVIGLDIAPYGAADVVADAHRLPFDNGSVAVVSAVEVLEHLRRPWVFVPEVARVLAPGGLFLGVVPQYCPTHGFPHDYFRFTRGGLEALADAAGLDMVEAWPLGGEWATLFHWYWANRAREHRLRRIPGVNLLFHLWFQALAWLADRADRRAGRGMRSKAQQHNDHVAWAFLARKPLGTMA